MGDDTGQGQERNTFRLLREKAGFPLLDDQDVCHIIAESSGGANHPDNYFVSSASFNRSAGNRCDHLFAYLAGLEATKKAVEVSRQTGWQGPSAEELYEQGKQAQKHATLYYTSPPVHYFIHRNLTCENCVKEVTVAIPIGRPGVVDKHLCSFCSAELIGPS